jgi:CheY-like chemotaxis protein
MIENKAKRRILVVDDESQIVFATSFALRMAGYSVTEAGGGQEGLDLLLLNHYQGESYDLIILDLIMPKITGLQLIDKMREMNLDTPIIVVTGVIQREIVRKLVLKGCQDVLFKPFDSDELLKKVEQIFNREAGDMKTEHRKLEKPF